MSPVWAVLRYFLSSLITICSPRSRTVSHCHGHQGSLNASASSFHVDSKLRHPNCCSSQIVSSTIAMLRTGRLSRSMTRTSDNVLVDTGYFSLWRYHGCIWPTILKLCTSNCTTSFPHLDVRRCQLPALIPPRTAK
jgi:hypothetical protein